MEVEMLIYNLNKVKALNVFDKFITRYVRRFCKLIKNIQYLDNT